MLSSIFLFIVGFLLLIKGASWLVDEASALSNKLGIPNFVTGLVIVGIGTSIPEFSITLLSNILGREGIGLGTIIGSNTFNILFILGLSAIVFPLSLKKHWVERDLIWNGLAVLVAIFFIFYPFNNSFLDPGISRVEGAVLLLLFGAWIYYSLRKDGEPLEQKKVRGLLHARVKWGFMVGGILGILLGGKWVTDGAIAIARELSISGQVIGLSIVAIGTSLPELTASVVAAFRKKPGIAVGNIVGSNIFDFLMILGFSAMVQPIAFPAGLEIDIAVTALSAFVLLAVMFVGKRFFLARWEGIIFVLLYLIYLGYLIWSV